MIKGFIGFVMAVIVIIFLVYGAMIYFAADYVNEQGGVKNALIDIGENTKDIIKEVREHE